MADDPNTPKPQSLPGNPQAPQAQRSEQRPGGPNPNAARGRDLAQERKAENDRLREERKNRPQQVGNEGQKPTPTQDENDAIRAGEMHIDDKEDDGSGPDIGVDRTLLPSQRRGYETR